MKRIPFVRPPQGFVSIQSAAELLGIERKAIEHALNAYELPFATYMRPAVCLELVAVVRWSEQRKAVQTDKAVL